MIAGLLHQWRYCSSVYTRALFSVAEGEAGEQVPLRYLAQAGPQSRCRPHDPPQREKVNFRDAEMAEL